MTGNKAQVGMIKQVKLMRVKQTVIKEEQEQKQKWETFRVEQEVTEKSNLQWNMKTETGNTD